jgi:hypothetical protein
MCTEMFGTLAKNRSIDSFVWTLREVKPMHCLVDVVAVLQDYIAPDMPYAPHPCCWVESSKPRSKKQRRLPSNSWSVGKHLTIGPDVDSNRGLKVEAVAFRILSLIPGHNVVLLKARTRERGEALFLSKQPPIGVGKVLKAIQKASPLTIIVCYLQTFHWNNR